MKVVWTAGDARQIPGPRHSGLRSGNSSGNYRRKFFRLPGSADTGNLSPDLNGNGEIEPEEWIKQCPCFDVAKEFKEFGEFADRTDETGSTEKHRVTQHIKEQKGGKLWQ